VSAYAETVVLIRNPPSCLLDETTLSDTSQHVVEGKRALFDRGLILRGVLLDPVASTVLMPCTSTDALSFAVSPRIAEAPEPGVG
jgi:hypothetical protein